MFDDPFKLIYIAIFIATLLLVEGIFYLVDAWRHSGGGAVNRRLRMIAARKDSRVVLSILRREQQGPLSYLLSRLFPILDRLLVQSGSMMPLGRLVLLAVGLGGATFLGLRTLLIGYPPALSAVVGTGVAAIPFVILSVRRRRRLRSFEQQLPDALDLIIRSLRAGHPVSSAMKLVANELPDPAGSEFGLAFDEMTYGLELSRALDNMAQRVPVPDLRLVVASIEIQDVVGGNLVETLSNLSSIIRDRFHLFGKARAMSAEGRYSAVIVSALPFIVLAFLSIARPSYYQGAAGDPLFWNIMGAGFLLLVIGIFMIWRTVNIKV